MPDFSSQFRSCNNVQCVISWSWCVTPLLAGKTRTSRRQTDKTNIVRRTVVLTRKLNTGKLKFDAHTDPVCASNFPLQLSLECLPAYFTAEH